MDVLVSYGDDTWKLGSTCYVQAVDEGGYKRWGNSWTQDQGTRKPLKDKGPGEGERDVNH